MIDNYDSFTYNLVQYFGELGVNTTVFRNDKISLAEITRMSPSQIVISPGPCTPNEAGLSLQIIERFAGQIPILGVCLGHQCIGQVFGAKVVKAKQVMHGKTSPIFHRQQGVLNGLPSPFEATRYHSLVLEQNSLPDCLQTTGWTLTADGAKNEIMAVRHQKLAVEGVQFHPESILTQHGHTILKTFLQNTRG